MSHLQELWERFESSGVLRARGAGPLYRRDVRRAYYAGAGDVLRLVLACMPDPDATDADCDDLAEDAVELLHALAAELDGFARANKGGA